MVIPAANKSFVFTVSPCGRCLPCYVVIDLGWCVRLSGLVSASSSRFKVHAGKRMKESKTVQQPQNHGNDHHAVQNGLDGGLHWDKAIYQPQQDADYY